MTSVEPRQSAAQRLCDEGLAHHRAGRLEEARGCYKKILQRDPKHFDALHLLAMICAQTGQAELSVALSRRAISVNPKVGAAHSLLGSALHALGRSEAALESHDKAIALQPSHAEAHNNRGSTLSDLGRHEEALASFDRAIAIDANYASAHHNRGIALYQLRRPDEAVVSFDAALALQNHPLIALDRSIALLQAGRFENAWPGYEARKLRWAEDIVRCDDQTQWRGQDLSGKRLFLHHEQGLGDTIQFCRYIKTLQDRGAQVVLSLQNPLRRLLQRSWPSVEILGEGSRPTSFDYHCPLMSLPLAFGTRLETIPASPSYLRTDAGRRAEFEAKLPAKTKRRVGLVWSGSFVHPNDHNRSIAFDQLAPVLAADVDWVSLQAEIRPSDVDAVRSFGQVGLHCDALKDFDDTAALVEAMDLVITVDTSVAHLAGALGKPVWILLPFSPDWRWLLDRSDSPWYPSARLFRQQRLGDWSSVVADLQEALAALGV